MKWAGLLLAFLGVAFAYSSSPAQEFPNCGDGAVHYSPLDPSFAKKIVMEALSAGAMPTDSVRQYSPQHTKWLITIAPDFMKSGTWTTVVYVGSKNSDAGLKISFIDHASYVVRTQLAEREAAFRRRFVGSNRCDGLCSRRAGAQVYLRGDG